MKEKRCNSINTVPAQVKGQVAVIKKHPSLFTGSYKWLCTFANSLQIPMQTTCLCINFPPSRQPVNSSQFKMNPFYKKSTDRGLKLVFLFVQVIILT